MKSQFYFLSYVHAILVVCRCIQMFFEIFVAREDTGQFIGQEIARKVTFLLTNLHVSWRLWF